MNLNECIINKSKNKFIVTNKTDERQFLSTSFCSEKTPNMSFSSKKKKSTKGNSTGYSSSTKWGGECISVLNSSSSRKSSSSKLTDENQSRIIVALTEGRGHAQCEVGIAVMSISHPHLTICQISDSQSYTNTLTKINILNPNEIVFPHTFDNFGGNRLMAKMKKQFPNIRYTSVPRSVFNKTSGLDMLTQLCIPSLNGVLLVLQHRYYALAAASALLTYIQENLYVYYSKESLKIDYQESEGYALIDVSTADRLELVCSAKPAQANRYSSLFGILNYCLTKVGTRKLRSLILQPPSKILYIEERLDCIEELMKNRDALTSIQIMLQKFSNVDSLLNLPAIIPEDPQQVSVRQLNYIINLNSIIDLVGPLKELISNLKQPFFVQLKSTLEDSSFNEIKEMVRKIVNDFAQPTKGQSAMHQRCFIIKPGHNELLDVVRKIFSERLNSMKEYVETLASKYNLALTLGNNQKKGYHIVLSLNKAQKRSLKKSDLPDEFIEINSSLNFFTMKTSELMNLSTRVDDIMRDILKISNMIIHSMIILIKQHINLFHSLCEGVAQLDVYQSLAQTSLENKYIRPKFGEYTEIKLGQHPLLNFLLPSKPIANSIFCSDHYNVHIITGPNGSGKSIFIRQLMLLQIMAQLGCYVPAESAIFKPANRMFARIYLDDNMEFHASSFVLEMKEIKYIMTTMTNNSLVIIDELGRSTAVEEGMSIAISILEQMAYFSSYIFITTHFSMLAKLHLMYPNIKTWQLETTPSGDDPRTFKLEYKYSLKPGLTTVGRYGVYIVRKVWPDSIVKQIDNRLDILERQPKTCLITPLMDMAFTKYKVESKMKHLKNQNSLFVPTLIELIRQYQEDLKKISDNIVISPASNQHFSHQTNEDKEVPEDSSSNNLDLPVQRRQYEQICVSEESSSNNLTCTQDLAYQKQQFEQIFTPEPPRVPPPYPDEQFLVLNPLYGFDNCVEKFFSPRSSIYDYIAPNEHVLTPDPYFKPAESFNLHIPISENNLHFYENSYLRNCDSQCSQSTINSDFIKILHPIVTVNESEDVYRHHEDSHYASVHHQDEYKRFNQDTDPHFVIPSLPPVESSQIIQDSPFLTNKDYTQQDISSLDHSYVSCIVPDDTSNKTDQPQANTSLDRTYLSALVSPEEYQSICEEFSKDFDENDAKIVNNNMSDKNTYKYYLSPIKIIIVPGLNNPSVSFGEEDTQNHLKYDENVVNSIVTENNSPLLEIDDNNRLEFEEIELMLNEQPCNNNYTQDISNDNIFVENNYAINEIINTIDTNNVNEQDINDICNYIEKSFDETEANLIDKDKDDNIESEDSQLSVIQLDKDKNVVKKTPNVSSRSMLKDNKKELSSKKTKRKLKKNNNKTPTDTSNAIVKTSAKRVPLKGIYNFSITNSDEFFSKTTNKKSEPVNFNVLEPNEQDIVDNASVNPTVSSKELINMRLEEESSGYNTKTEEFNTDPKFLNLESKCILKNVDLVKQPVLNISTPNDDINIINNNNIELLNLNLEIKNLHIENSLNSDPNHQIINNVCETSVTNANDENASLEINKLTLQYEPKTRKRSKKNKNSKIRNKRKTHHINTKTNNIGTENDQLVQKLSDSVDKLNDQIVGPLLMDYCSDDTSPSISKRTQIKDANDQIVETVLKDYCYDNTVTSKSKGSKSPKKQIKDAVKLQSPKTLGLKRQTRNKRGKLRNNSVIPKSLNVNEIVNEIKDVKDKIPSQNTHAINKNEDEAKTDASINISTASRIRSLDTSTTTNTIKEVSSLISTPPEDYNYITEWENVTERTKYQMPNKRDKLKRNSSGHISKTDKYKKIKVLTNIVIKNNDNISNDNIEFANSNINELRMNSSVYKIPSTNYAKADTSINISDASRIRNLDVATTTIEEVPYAFKSSITSEDYNYVTSDNTNKTSVKSQSTKKLRVKYKIKNKKSNLRKNSSIEIVTPNSLNVNENINEIKAVEYQKPSPIPPIIDKNEPQSGTSINISAASRIRNLDTPTTTVKTKGVSSITSTPPEDYDYLTKFENTTEGLKYQMKNTGEKLKRKSSSSISKTFKFKNLDLLSNIVNESNNNNICNENIHQLKSVLSDQKNIDKNDTKADTSINISAASRIRNLDAATTISTIEEESSTSKTSNTPEGCNYLITSNKSNKVDDKSTDLSNIFSLNVSSASRNRNLDNVTGSNSRVEEISANNITNISYESRKRNLEDISKNISDSGSQDKSKAIKPVFKKRGRPRLSGISQKSTRSSSEAKGTTSDKDTTSNSILQTSVSSASKKRNLDNSSNTDSKSISNELKTSKEEEISQCSSSNGFNINIDSAVCLKNRNPVICKKFIPPKKLTAKKIRQEFSEQDKKFFESGPNELDMRKYYEQKINRPSVEQIQNATHLATLKKTVRGFEIVSANKKQKASHKRTITKTFSSNSIDMSIFSDKNAKCFNEFINSKESDFKNFTSAAFKASSNAVCPPTETAESIFDYYVENNQNVNCFNNADDINESLTPSGYYKDNKVVIDAVMNKYLNSPPSSCLPNTDGLMFNIFDNFALSNEDLDL